MVGRVSKKPLQKSNGIVVETQITMVSKSKQV